MSRRPPHNDPYTGDTVPMYVPDRDRSRPALPPAEPRRSRRAHNPPPAQPPNPPMRRRAQRGNPIARWFRRIVLLLMAGLVVALVGTIVFQQRVANKVEMADVRQNRPPGNVLLAPMNILLLGVDLRENAPDEGVRSDTLMLLHLDPIGGWASLLSIPRDTFVELPTLPDGTALGQNKINTAFARGYENVESFGAETLPTAAGAALAADTVEQFLGLREQGQRINYVATINFNGFAKMIDAIGGITVDVPFEIVDTEYPTEDFGYTTIRIPAGQQQMDGKTALQYVRTRHADSDFGRAQRQQQVIQAIVRKLRDQPLLLRPISALRLIDAAGDATKTTLPVGRLDALLMAGMLARIDPARITQYRISPDEVGLQEVGSDLVWDPAGVQAVVAKALMPPGEAQERATVQVQNGSSVAGLAGKVTALLATQDFTLAAADNAEPVPESRIIDYGTHPLTRERLTRALGGMPVSEAPAADAPAGVDIVIILGDDYAQYIRDQ